MKKSIIKIVFISFLFSIFFTESISSQGLDQYSICDQAKIEIEKYAQYLTEHTNIMITLQKDNLNAIKEDLFDKKGIENINTDDILSRAAINLLSYVFKEGFKSTPIAALCIEKMLALSQHLNEKDQNQGNTKNKNKLLNAKAMLIAEINKKMVGNHQEDHESTIMDSLYLIKKLSCEEIIKEIKEEKKKLKRKEIDLINEGYDSPYWGLINYQSLLQIWYGMTNGKYGYIKVDIDCTNFLPINQIKMKGDFPVPNTVKISLAAGSVSLQIENHLNELVAKSLEYISVLNLDMIPKKIYSYYKYHQTNDITIPTIVSTVYPIIEYNGELNYPWNNDEIKLKSITKSTSGYKYSEEKLSYKSIYGFPHKLLFKAPYTRVSTMNSVYQYFSEFQTGEVDIMYGLWDEIFEDIGLIDKKPRIPKGN